MERRNGCLHVSGPHNLYLILWQELEMLKEEREQAQHKFHDLETR